MAERLIKRLQSRPQSRVLDFAAGHGRNAEALRRAGFCVVAVGDDTAESETPIPNAPQPFTAALSTHGLLHGTPAAIAARLSAIAQNLHGGGLLYATFGSTSDRRFGKGARVDDFTFVPLDGDERGILHAYFDRDALLGVLQREFQIEELAETCADDTAGAWAHRERPLRGAVHWFAIAHKR